MISSTQWTAFRLAKPRPLGGNAPSIWLNHLIYWGIPGLQALHAHTKYTTGVQLCVGVSFHPNSQIGGLCPCRSHTSTVIRARGTTPSNPATRGDTPSWTHRVYILAQGWHQKSVNFFPQSMLYISGDFHTSGPFPERIVLFQVSETVYDA